MQNLPGIELEKTSEQFKAVAFSHSKKNGDQFDLFADLFDQHSTRIEKELALTPVSTKEQLVDTAPITADEQVKHVNVTSVEAPKPEEQMSEPEHERNERMTQEDFDEVKEDLEAYGLSKEEIADIEEKINSEEGMTWGQFVSTLADKMADMRKIELSDEQKSALGTFFSKLGFTPKESSKLLNQMENGEHAEVMAAMQKKINDLPKGKNMLFTKEELEAFSAAMNFSKEFTGKLKEALAKNALAKDVKEAFSMIRQEMAELDAKDRDLVKAVGNAFAKSLGKEVKENSVAKNIQEAVDLKPRVAEDNPKAQAREDFKDAISERKDSMPEANARKTEQKATPEKAQADLMDQNQNNDADDAWNNFFGKLREDNNSTRNQQFQAKVETLDTSIKQGLAEANINTKSRAWEKIAAPKVMQQVENAFIKTLDNGAKQLTVQLTPENLGKMNVMLQVNGKEVSAIIKAESPDAARIIAENIDIIKNSLEQQGLKVEKLEVQTGLTNGQDYRDWAGQEQHNMARDREVMIAMRQHMKAMRGDGDGLAQDMQNQREQAINADQGLHVIA